MLNRTLSLCCAALLIVAVSARAQNLGDGLQAEPDESTTRIGTRGATFLEIPVGARGQALAGAATAIIRGVEAMAWNVAAIAEVETFNAGWSYSELFDELDITHQFVGLALPIGSSSAIGASVVAMSSGDIVRTSERFPEGGDPQFGRTFDFTAFAAQLAWGQQITDRLDAGIGVKLVREGIDNASVDWLGLDLGVLFRTGLLGTTFGATIQNIGGNSSFTGSAIERVIAATQDAFPSEDNVPVAFDTDELALPTLFRFSVLFDLTGTPEALFVQVPQQHHLRVAADFFDAIDTALEPSVGFEYSFREIVFGRVGKRFFNENRDDFRDFTDGLSFGGGARVPVFGNHLQLDYAYTDMGLLENIQTFSIQFGS